MIDKEQVNENWRTFGRTMVAYPAQTRKAMQMFYGSLVVAGVLMGALLTSLVWMLVA